MAGFCVVAITGEIQCADFEHYSGGAVDILARAVLFPTDLVPYTVSDFFGDQHCLVHYLDLVIQQHKREFDCMCVGALLFQFRWSVYCGSSGVIAAAGFLYWQWHRYRTVSRRSGGDLWAKISVSETDRRDAFSEQNLSSSNFVKRALNNVLEPTKLSWLEFEGDFGFVSSLPAKLLLQTRLAAQHHRYFLFKIFKQFKKKL